MNAPPVSPKKKILCIADLPDWIFNRHIEYLRRYLSDEFEITTAYRGEAFREDDYDLVYALEYMLVTPEQITNPQKYVTGIRSWVSWADQNFSDFIHYLNSNFQRVHAVSRELYEVFSPYLQNLVFMGNGIDLELFSPGDPPGNEAGKLRLGWAGRRDTFIKGFIDYIQPLEELPGVELKYCGFADRNLTLDEMPGFYNGIDAYVCASSFEGHNNSIMEAAAMERAIITTRVGNTAEYLVDGESALFVDRELGQFRQAVEKLRDNPDLRRRMGIAARKQLMQQGWDWRQRAEEFRRFFNEAIQQMDRSSPAAADIKEPVVIDREHLLEVLRSQHKLLHEMRNGDWVLIMGQKAQIQNLKEESRLLEKELEDIRSSESYRLMMRIGNSRLISGLRSLVGKMRRRA